MGFFSEVQGLFSSLLLLCFCFVVNSSILTHTFLGYGIAYSSFSDQNIVSYSSSNISAEAETSLILFFRNHFVGFPKMQTTNVFGFLSSTVTPDL